MLKSKISPHICTCSVVLSAAILVEIINPRRQATSVQSYSHASEMRHHDFVCAIAFPFSGKACFSLRENVMHQSKPGSKTTAYIVYMLSMITVQQRGEPT